MTPSKPITYPVYPTDGGTLEYAFPKLSPCLWSPKINGWRVLVHVESKTVFNRKGELSTINFELDAALEKIKSFPFEWLDCEGLDRRHKLGRGALVILDAPIPGTALERYEKLYERLVGAEFCGVMPVDEPVAPGSVTLMPQFRSATAVAPRSAVDSQIPLDIVDEHALWARLQEINRRLGVEYYEGLVAKTAGSVYPIQLQNPDRKNPVWIKHRWAR